MKALWPFLALAILTIVLIVCLVNVETPPGSFTDKPVYVTSGNLFKDVFTETFETAYIMLRNGDWYSFSTQDEFSVGIGACFIREFLRLQDRKVSEIAVIIHNHFQNPHFSPADKRQYQLLKSYGFRGGFLLYHQASGKTFKLGDEGEEEEIDQDFGALFGGPKPSARFEEGR